MKCLYVLLLLSIMFSESVACSYSPPAVDLELKKQWNKGLDSKYFKQIDSNIPSPIVKVIKVKRAVIAPAFSCADAGYIEIEISLPENSPLNIKDYSVYFTLNKGKIPDRIIPEFPVFGWHRGNKKYIELVWLDGHPDRQKDINAAISVNLVAQNLKRGASGTLEIHLPKSTFAMEKYWSWFSIPGLLRIIKDKKKEDYIRIAAVKKLGQFGFSYFLRDISYIISSKSEPISLKREVAMAWVNVKKEAALNYLVEMANTSDPIQLSIVIEVLQAYYDKRAFKIILDGLRSQYPKVRLASVNALLQATDRNLRQHIHMVLNDDNLHVRTGAAVALGSMRDKRAFHVLIDLLDRQSGVDLAKVVMGLTLYKDKRVVNPLIDILRKEKGIVRQTALYVLRQINTPEAQNAVKKFEGLQSR